MDGAIYTQYIHGCWARILTVYIWHLYLFSTSFTEERKNRKQESCQIRDFQPENVSEDAPVWRETCQTQKLSILARSRDTADSGCVSHLFGSIMTWWSCSNVREEDNILETWLKAPCADTAACFRKTRRTTQRSCWQLLTRTMKRECNSEDYYWKKR